MNNRIDVWTYTLSGDERVEQLLEVLADEEKARYRKFRFERHAREFLCAHSLLRIALSQYANIEPRGWKFALGRWGKPYIASGPVLNFNLSHTKGFVACAIARDCEVGVDVETMERPVAFGEISQRFFAEEEVRYLERLPEESKRDAFFRFWTLKEAYLKGCGRGFDLPLREFWFDLSSVPVRFSASADWRFWEFRPTSEYRMALAARRIPAVFQQAVVSLRDGAALIRGEGGKKIDD